MLLHLEYNVAENRISRPKAENHFLIIVFRTGINEISIDHKYNALYHLRFICCCRFRFTCIR